MRTSSIILAMIQIVLVLSIQGCYYGGFLQDAKPIEKGKKEITAGITGYYQGDDIAPPGANFVFRQGVGNRTDWGINIGQSLLFSAKVDVKYLITSPKRTNYYWSVIGGLEAIVLSDFGNDRQNGVSPIIGTMFSWGHHKKAGFYLGQRLNFGLSGLAIITGNTPEPDHHVNLQHQMFISGCIGIFFGPYHQYMVELNYAVREAKYYSTYEVQSNTFEVTSGSSRDVGFGLSLGYRFNRGKKTVRKPLP